MTSVTFNSAMDCQTVGLMDEWTRVRVGVRYNPLVWRIIKCISPVLYTACII